MHIKDLPALKYLLLFCPGILIGQFCRVPLLLAIAVFLPILVALKCVSNARWKQIGFASCIVLCGVLRFSMADEVYHEKHRMTRGEGDIVLTVLSQKSNPYYLESYTVQSRIGGERIKGTLYAKKGATVLIPGKSYETSRMIWENVSSDKNPYVFNYADYAKTKGISHRFKFSKTSEIKEVGVSKPLVNLAYKIRSDLSTRFLCVLGIEKGSLVNGLLLGMKSEIPVGLADLFRQLGVSHLLAVSGLHVGLIVLILYQLLLTLSIPRIPRTAVVTVFLILYCFITGGSPSVVRSSLMTVMLMLAPVFGRKYQALNAVAASAVILLLVNPFSIRDLGFQFSYSAVFGILIAYPKIREYVKFKRSSVAVNYIVDMLAVSLSATLFTSPVAIFYFNTLQLVSMCLNLVVIPLTFCVMICAIISLPGLYIRSFFSDLAIHALDISLDIFRGVLRLASRSDIWTLSISSYWKPLVFCLLIVGTIYICAEQTKWKKWLAIGSVITCLLWWCLQTRPEIIAPDLKKGKIIASRVGQNALIINTGSIYYNYNDYERYLRPALDHWGIKNVLIVITQWEKGFNSNIPSLRNRYPEAPVFVPSSVQDTDSEICRIDGDTLIVWGKQKIQIRNENKTLLIKYNIGHNIIEYHDTVSINKKGFHEHHCVFYRNKSIRR